jgi:hypothetical protein
LRDIDGGESGGDQREHKRLRWNLGIRFHWSARMGDREIVSCRPTSNTE